ncbi:MAG: cobalamin-dependent protein [Desulfobacula sp.]|nr:cobalamin-dependent protein [Desulfobacula sp.]
MDTSRVLLVQPPIEDFYLTKKRTIPYGLASIAANIIKKGFHVNIIDGLATPKSKPIDLPKDFSYLKPFYGRKDTSLFSLFHNYYHFGYSYEHIGKLVKDKQPFVVGISSLFTAYADQALKTAQIIKKFYPECTIVMGGHHPTVFAEKVLKHDAVDIVLQGEGEESMASLCVALKNADPIDQIPGIAYRTKDTNIIQAPSWINDLKSLPQPSFELINQKFYQRKKRGSAIVVSSRGCPMQCSYCSVSASSSYAGYRRRPVEHVIDEIQAQLRYRDIGFIDFEDENLCLNKEWFISLFSKLTPLLKGKNIELRAMNGLYPVALDDDIVSVLKENGFKTLNLSLGSTCKYQLKRFKRPDVRSSFENALFLAQKHALECVSYLIAAAPGQTAKNSLSDLISLAAKRTLVGLSIFYPAPGSLDYQYCRDQNLLPKNFALMRSTALPVEDTTSRLEAITLLRLSRILNFIKSIMDIKGHVPSPESFQKETKLPINDRLASSTKLLQWFLQDGIIRGVTPEGKIYIHKSDLCLTRTFVKKIKEINVCGIKSSNGHSTQSDQ